MTYKHYLKITKLIFLFFSVLILGIFILPLVLLFVKKEDKNLPSLFSWWDNPKYGINGNADWEKRLNDYGWGFKPTDFWSRYIWLIRNPVGGFNKQYLAITIPKGTMLTHSGDSGVGDKVKDGYSFIESSSGHFELYHIKTWSSKFELVRRIGWKLHGKPTTEDGYMTQDETANFVFRINPFKKAHK